MVRVGAPVDPALADWHDVHPEAGIPNGVMRRTAADGAPAWARRHQQDGCGGGSAGSPGTSSASERGGRVDAALIPPTSRIGSTVAELMYLYGSGVHAHDPQMVASCFADDAVLDYGATAVEGIDGVLQYFTECDDLALSRERARARSRRRLSARRS